MRLQFPQVRRWTSRQGHLSSPYTWLFVKSLSLDFSCASCARFVCWILSKETLSLSEGEFSYPTRWELLVHRAKLYWSWLMILQVSQTRHLASHTGLLSSLQTRLLDKSLRLDFSHVSWARFVCWIPHEETLNPSYGEFSYHTQCKLLIPQMKLYWA